MSNQRTQTAQTELLESVGLCPPTRVVPGLLHTMVQLSPRYGIRMEYVNVPSFAPELLGPLADDRKTKESTELCLERSKLAR